MCFRRDNNFLRYCLLIPFLNVFYLFSLFAAVCSYCLAICSPFISQVFCVYVYLCPFWLDAKMLFSGREFFTWKTKTKATTTKVPKKEK